MGVRVPVRARWQVTLPREVRAVLGVQPGDAVEFEIGKDGVVLVRGIKSFPVDMARVRRR